MLKRLLSHTAIYGVAPLVPRIVGIFILPFITPFLTENDFGIYGIVTAAVATISAFSNLGLNVVLGNIYYKHTYHYKTVWRQVYGFLILWSIPFAIITSVVLIFFVPEEAKENRLPIILLNVLPIVLFGPSSLLGIKYYQLQQKPMQIAIRSFVIGIITVLLNLYFIRFLRMGYMGWFVSSGIAQILLQATYWKPLNFQLQMKPILKFRRKTIQQLLRISLPTISHYYGSFLVSTSDRFLMKILGVPTGDIGKYSAANTVSNGFQMLGTASGQAVSPMLLQSYKNNDEKSAQRLIFTLQIIFFFGTFVCSIWLKEIFSVLIKNDSLKMVYPLGIILVMSYNYRPIYMGAINKLIYNEKTKILMRVTLIAGIVNLVINLILIPIFGYQVAAYTTFAAMMYMGYSGYFLKEYKKIKAEEYYPYFWLTVTVILTVFAYFIVELSILLKSIFSIVAFLCAGISLLHIRKYY